MGEADRKLAYVRVAVADLGTNSLIWLIADVGEGKVVPVNEDCLEPRLGEGLSRTGRISDESKERTLKALEQFLAQAADVPRKVVATEVLRRADNAGRFIKVVKEKLGIDIEIISSDEEARLSFLGSIEGLGIRGQCVVVDVGGGSTEIVSGTKSRLGMFRSYKVGAVFLRDKFGPPPYTDSTVNNVLEFANHIFSDLLFKSDRFVAVGGTASYAGAILAGAKEFNPYELHGNVVRVSDWMDLWKRLCVMFPSEIVELVPFAPNRADILPCGMAIFIAVAQKLSSECFIVSTKGLRYALAREFASQIQTGK